MRTITKVAALVAMLAVPAAGFAGQAAPAKKAPAAKSAQPAKAEKGAKKVAGHSTSGTVKSVSDTQLVITKSGKKATDETFVVNSSTEKKGTIDTGAHVQVRYTMDGKNMVATSINAAAAKAPKPAKKGKK